MEPSIRTGPPPLVMNYLIPIALLGVALSVLMDRGRVPTDDRIILIVVIAIAAKLYLRDRRLIAAALAFAAASWALDAGDAPEWIARALRTILGEPGPDANLDPWDARAVVKRFDEEVRLYGFVVMNALAFTALLAGASIRRRRLAALHDSGSRD